MLKTIYKSFNLEKSNDKSEYDFEGYLSKYGNKDRHNDIIVKGAFKDAIKRKEKYVLLEEHNSSKKIGYFKAINKNDGVYIYAKLFEDEECLKIKKLIKEGAYSDMSVGLGIESKDDYEYDEVNKSWNIKKAYIREGSVVLAPANEQAIITSVKSLIEKEEAKNMPKNYDMEIKEKQLEIEKLEKEKAKLQLDVDKSDENSDLDLISTKAETIDEIDKSIAIAKSEVEKLHFEKTEARSQLEIIKGRNEMHMNNAKQDDSLSSKNSYMKSEHALKDFSQLFVKCASNGDDFEKAWANHIKNKGLTNPDVFTPPGYVNMIKDCIEDSGLLYNLFTKIKGQSYWKEITEVGEEIGQGHKPGTTKVEQNLTFVAKELTTQYIYKYIPVDKKSLRDAAKNTTGVNPLLEFVTKELLERVVYTIEKAVYVGDGLLPTDDKKITSIEAIVKADPQFVSKVEKSITTDELIDADTVEELVTEISSKNKNNLVMVMHRTVASAMRKIRDNNGIKVYEQGTVNINGVTYDTLDNIPYVERDWMPSLADAKASANVDYLIIHNYKQYKILEDSAGMEFYRDFVLKANKEEFLAEMNCGGAQFGCKSAAFLTTIA